MTKIKVTPLPESEIPDLRNLIENYGLASLLESLCDYCDKKSKVEYKSDRKSNYIRFNRIRKVIESAKELSLTIPGP